MGVLATFVDVVPCLLPACAAPVLVTERRKVLVLCCRAVLTCACVWAVWRLCAVAVAVEVAVVAVAVALMATPPTVVASTTTTSAAVAVAVTSSRLPAKTGTRTWTLCRGGLTSSRQGGWFASQMRSLATLVCHGSAFNTTDPSWGVIPRSRVPLNTGCTYERCVVAVGVVLLWCRTPSVTDVSGAVAEGTPVAVDGEAEAEAEPVVEEPEDTSVTLDAYRAALAEKRTVRHRGVVGRWCPCLAASWCGQRILCSGPLLVCSSWCGFTCDVVENVYTFSENWGACDVGPGAGVGAVHGCNRAGRFFVFSCVVGAWSSL